MDSEDNQNSDNNRFAFEDNMAQITEDEDISDYHNLLLIEDAK